MKESPLIFSVFASFSSLCSSGSADAMTKLGFLLDRLNSSWVLEKIGGRLDSRREVAIKFSNMRNYLTVVLSKTQNGSSPSGSKQALGIRTDKQTRIYLRFSPHEWIPIEIIKNGED